jgi:hypothetical protein
VAILKRAGWAIAVAVMARKKPVMELLFFKSAVLNTMISNNPLKKRKPY